MNDEVYCYRYTYNIDILLAISCICGQQCYIINPRHNLAERVTVVVSCVCLSAHAILAVRAIRSITKDAIVFSVRFAGIEKAFFLKLSYSKVRAFFTHLGRGGHH